MDEHISILEPFLTKIEEFLRTYDTNKNFLGVDATLLAAYIGPSFKYLVAGWSSLVARRAHNPKVVGSNPAPATNSSELEF